MGRKIDMKKVTGVLLLLVVLGSGLWWLGGEFKKEQSVEDISNGKVEIEESVGEDDSEGVVNLVVDFGEERRELEVEAYEEMTALSVLLAGMEANAVEVELEHYEFGDLVTKIGAFESTADRSWIYFVNGESGNVGADQAELVAGDTVEWKYIEPEY